jgi:hypothetical protein
MQKYLLMSKKMPTFAAEIWAITHIYVIQHI